MSNDPISAGVACADITPPAGLATAGFAARRSPAVGAHDTLTVRALVVGDTALAVADVIGIDAKLSARLRARCDLPATNMTLTAVRRGARRTPDAAFMDRLENAFVEAILQAAATRAPVRLSGGTGGTGGSGGAADANGNNRSRRRDPHGYQFRTARREPRSACP